jgi:hypothetical protein
MNNWEAIHECLDQRDAERLRKRAALTAESLAMTYALSKTPVSYTPPRILMESIGSPDKVLILPVDS